MQQLIQREKEYFAAQPINLISREKKGFAATDERNPKGEERNFEPKSRKGKSLSESRHQMRSGDLPPFLNRLSNTVAPRNTGNEGTNKFHLLLADFRYCQYMKLKEMS